LKALQAMAHGDPNELRRLERHGDLFQSRAAARYALHTPAPEAF